MAEKVLVSVSEHINRLVAIRAQADILGTDLVAVARTSLRIFAAVTTTQNQIIGRQQLHLRVLSLTALKLVMRADSKASVVMFSSIPTPIFLCPSIITVNFISCSDFLSSWGCVHSKTVFDHQPLFEYYHLLCLHSCIWHLAVGFA